MKIECYGDFYALQFGDETYQCRSTLEIFRSTQTLRYPNELLGRTPDVVVIMMNPDSSRPCEDITPRQLCSASHIKLCPCLVRTIPDDAQYQIMRIMDEKDLQHTRVLNLSDIRMGKDFLKDFPVQGCDIPGHSIFCSDRNDERQHRLVANRNLIIAGWGMEWGSRSRTRSHAERRYGIIVDTNLEIIGQCDSRRRYLYGYPFPKKSDKKFEWLNHVLSRMA